MPLATTHFCAGQTGPWEILSIDPVVGPSLPPAARLLVTPDGHPETDHLAWALSGVASDERYVHRSEKVALQARQPPLERPEARYAALLPIRKSAAWWSLAQDERRAIFEEASHHIAIGMEYLPGVARRLYQSRDLGEPFDFITWFEYSEAQIPQCDTLVHRLRHSAEWQFVEHEVDIRLRRVAFYLHMKRPQRGVSDMMEAAPACPIPCASGPGRPSHSSWGAAPT